MSGERGFLLGFAEGVVGSADNYLAEEREFDRKMTLQEWQHQKQVELAKLRDGLSRETEKWKLTDPELKAERSLLTAEEQGNKFTIEEMKQEGMDRRARMAADASASGAAASKSTDGSKKVTRQQMQKALMEAAGVDDIGEGFDKTWPMFNKDNKELDKLYDDLNRRLSQAKTLEREDEIFELFLEKLALLSGGGTTDETTGAQTWDLSKYDSGP